MPKKHEKIRLAILAPIYDIFAIFPHILTKDLLQKVGKEKSKKVFNPACRSGSLSLSLANDGHSVVGIDFSSVMLKIAKIKSRNNKNVIFINSEIEGIKFLRPYFDVSIVSFAFHEMSEDSTIDLLKEIKKLTKKDGKIIIVDYDKPKNLLHKVIMGLFGIWEPPSYWNFLKTGLSPKIEKVKLTTFSKEERFFGLARVIECVNK